MSAIPRLAHRFELAANLKALLEHADMSPPTLARRSGVDRKSINNMLNARFDAKYENIEKVGRVFGLTGWQMLRRLDSERIEQIPKAAELETLIERYYSADEEHRKTILNIAELIGRSSPR